MTEATGKYSLPLKDDLTGWKNVRIQVDVLPKGSQQRIVKLKEAFDVRDKEGSNGFARGFFDVKGKSLVNEGASVEFYLLIRDGTHWKDLGKDPQFHIQVEVTLDLSAMAQAVGSFVGGFLGSAAGDFVTSHLPQEMSVLQGDCLVSVQVPEFALTLKKTRWMPLEIADLTEYAEESDLASLYRDGGELRVPAKVQAKQETAAGSVEFAADLAVCDVEGELNWMGKKIKGEYRDAEDAKREFLVFPIPAKASTLGAADVPPSGMSHTG